MTYPHIVYVLRYFASTPRAHAVVNQYQYTFFPNTQWSAAYAPGSEIQAYLENVVSTYQLAPYIKLRHEMTNAIWDDIQGKWRVSMKKSKDTGGVDPSDEVFEDSADILFTAIGSLSRWDWPDIEGLQDFDGTLVHSAGWDVEKGNAVIAENETSLTAPNNPLKPEAEVKAPSRKAWQDDVKDWGNKKVGVIGVVRCTQQNCCLS